MRTARLGCPTHQHGLAGSITKVQGPSSLSSQLSYISIGYWVAGHVWRRFRGGMPVGSLGLGSWRTARLPRMATTHSSRRALQASAASGWCFGWPTICSRGMLVNQFLLVAVLLRAAGLCMDPHGLASMLRLRPQNGADAWRRAAGDTRLCPPVTACSVQHTQKQGRAILMGVPNSRPHPQKQLQEE